MMRRNWFWKYAEGENEMMPQGGDMGGMPGGMPGGMQGGQDPQMYPQELGGNPDMAQGGMPGGDAGEAQGGISRDLVQEVSQMPPEQLQLLSELIENLLSGEGGGAGAGAPQEDMYPQELGGDPGMAQGGMPGGDAGMMPGGGAAGMQPGADMGGGNGPMIIPTEGDPYPASLGGDGGAMPQ